MLSRIARRDRRPHVLLAPLFAVLVACGGSGVPDPTGGAGAGTGATPRADAVGSGADGSGANGSGAGDGSATGDAPVTVTLDGVTYGYDIGTCDVGEDAVRASAGRSDGSISSAEIAWARDGSRASFRATDVSTTSGPPAPFELYADPDRADTTWDVRVDGATATIEARMRNELPAAKGNPDLERYDVTIVIRCDERGFGGMAPEPADDQPPPDGGAAPSAAGESTVTLELAGQAYAISYPGCPLTESELAVSLTEPATGAQLFLGAGEAVLLLADGSPLQATGVAFAGSDTSATWSGTMNGPTGSESVTITISC